MRMWKWTLNLPRDPGPGAAVGCVMEPMESRQLLAAGPTLVLQNLDGIPGNERMIFNRVNQPNPTIPNVVHDKGKLRLKNTGGQTLKLTGYTISGPWKIISTRPATLAAGKYVDLTIQFTATKPPPFTYNQTNGTTKPRSAGAYAGSLTTASNDAARPKQVEQLAGWYQERSEDNQEPSLQTIINLISNYKTTIASTKMNTLPEPSGKKLFGEEVNSAYWTASNPTSGVYVRQLAAFHGQGSQTTLFWHTKGSTATKKLFTAAGNEGQSFLPHLQGNPAAAAAATFKPGTAKFGWKVDGEWSDDTRNTRGGGGHHIRFYPVKDHNGRAIANTYFMVVDYAISGSENYDFQDTVFVISGIKPAGN